MQSVPRDLWPGSTFTYDLRSLNNSGTRRKYFSDFPASLLYSGLGEWSFNVHFNPSYQPTEAALDWKGHTRAVDGAITGGSSWFDGTLVQTAARRHEELTVESKDKVMNWLNSNRNYPYLATPMNLAAKMLQGGAIMISYDPSVFEEGVAIERKSGDGAYASIAAAAPNAGSYTDRDPSLQPFGRYTYRVRSFSGPRMSGYSAEVSVTLHPHLASSTASALGAAPQRKALQTTAGYNNRFMAYESIDGSFLVRFIQDDEHSGTWEAEQAIGGVASPELSYRSPSLFPDSSGSGVRIVYDEVNSAAGTHTIRQAMFSDATATVNVFPDPLALIAASDAFQTMPSAATTDHVPDKPPSLLAAVWRYELNAGLALGLGVSGSDGSLRWSAADLNGGVLGAPVIFATSPSIAAVLRDQSKPPAYHVYLAWEEENHGGVFGGIRLLHGRYTPGDQPWPPIASQVIWESGQPFTVAQNMSGEVHRRPSVAVDGSGNVVVAWESSTQTAGKILLQKRNGFAAGTVIGSTLTIAAGSGASAMPHAVSMADYRTVPGIGDNLTLVWYTDGGGSYAAWYDAAANFWSAPRLLDEAARQPSIAATKSAAAQNRVIASIGSSGPPYAILPLSAGALPPPLPAPQLSWQAVIVNNVKRARLSWTPVGPDLQAYDVYLYACDAGAGDCGSGAFHALQTSTSSLAYTDMNTIVFTKTGANLAPDRTIYYYVAARDKFNQRGSASKCFAVNTDEAFAWKQPAEEDDRGVPKSYDLSENYPNPFNPATSFRYQLPSPGDVRFAVYNMIGEEVMVLADLRQEAGYYEAAWDAAGSPSGTYVALMRVTGDAGRVVYSAAKKVLLVR